MKSIHQLTLALVSVGIASFLFSSPLSAQTTGPSGQVCSTFTEIDAEYNRCTLDAFKDVKALGDYFCKLDHGQNASFGGPDDNQCYVNGQPRGSLSPANFDSLLAGYDADLAQCMENRKLARRCLIQEILDEYATRP